MKPIWLCLIDPAGWKSRGYNELWIDGELGANADQGGEEMIASSALCLYLYLRNQTRVCICICICVFAKPDQGGEGERGGNDCINIYSRRKRLQGSGNQYKLIWNEPLDCDFYSDAGENTIDCISETGEVNCNFFLCAPKWSFFERSMNVGKVKFPAKHCARVWYNEMINQILYDLIKLDRWPQKGLL